MIDYDDIEIVNEQLKMSQEADFDNRDMAKEAHNFLDKRDGQWEPEIISRMTGRPRYTFDKCNPVVDGIAGEMEQADFDIRIRPSGGDATKELAKTYDGLVRNIETISNASHVYSSAGRDMVAAGIGGWEVSVDWVNGDSFNQDFIIKWISDFEGRVWFDAGAIAQDMSDARHVFILDNLTRDEYETRFPDGSGEPIGSNQTSETYTFKPEFITVGRIIYLSPITIDIVLMTDGSVYEQDDDFKKVSDDLAEQGITEVRSRKKKTFKVVSRLFDGSNFLNEPEDTVFKQLPIIPTFGNFKVREGKVIWRGAIEKLMDAQRVYNYTRSREIEDVALSPPDVTWASRKQLENPSDRLAAENMSTSAQRVYLFTPDEKNPGPPARTAGPSISPGLQQATQNSIDDIQTSAARAPIQDGAVDGPMSGIAIQALQNKGDTGTIKYFKSQEIAICRTARVLVDAIPSLYDSTTQKRILNEDGSFDMIELNKSVVDRETTKTVKLNDLSQGKYDVTCDVGPAFKNRQQESVKALSELAAAIPGVGEMSADILMKNISSPGVDLVAERVRKQMIQGGLIPESQLNDDEKAEIQQAQQLAAQQPADPTPDEKFAQAEVERVQAETQDVIVKAQLKQEELRIREQETLLKAQNAAERLQLEELSLMLRQQAQQSTEQQATNEAIMKGQQSIIDNLNTQASTLKILREAQGVDAFTGPHTTEAFIQQAETITDQQDEIQLTTETDDITN